MLRKCFPGSAVLKNPLDNAGDMGLIPGLGRYPGEGNSNPPPYSCLENPTDRGAWWDIAHGVTKIWTRLTTKQQQSGGGGGGFGLQPYGDWALWQVMVGIHAWAAWRSRLGRWGPAEGF